MQMIEPFIVVEGNTPGQLARSVSQFVSDGYVLRGGLIVAQQRTGPSGKIKVTQYLQAMVLPLYAQTPHTT